MTNPTQMNCEHSPDGWCLACVQALAKEDRAIRRLFCVCYEAQPYMDDGEAQGSNINYLIDSAEEIIQKIRNRNGFK